MPEVTENYIHLPASKGHGKHRLRTITLSDAKGIKALYCGTCKEIATYLFDKKRWGMAEAKKWIREHKDGGKSMEFDAVVIEGNEVLVEDLIDAYKAREDVTGEGAREKAKEAQEKRSGKYGIAIRKGGNVTKPGEWEDVPDSEWGDPVNYAYPCPDIEQTQAALRYWGKPKNKGKYSSEDQATITARLKKFAKKFKVGEFADKSLDDLDDKSVSLDAQTRQVRDAWYAHFRKPPTDMSTDAWPKEIFDDHIIVETKDGLYQYPYEIDDEGEIIFGEPIKVEMTYTPVSEGKSFDFCVKRLGETDEVWRIGSYGLFWGSPQTRDLSWWPNKDGSKGEFFTPQTAGLDDLPVKVITFEHDKEVGPAPKHEPIHHPMGHTILERDDTIGRWVEAQVEKRRKYAQYVMELVDKRELSFSSETASHWREAADNGEIKRWRTAGYTLTTHPMEPRLTDVEHLRAYYKSLDMDLAEPDTGGADERSSGLEAEKAVSEIELLLLDIELEDKT